MPRPMRKQFDNNMKGVLFENQQKRGDNDPDMKGSTEIDGVEYWVAAWWNPHAQKGEYLKTSYTRKESDDRSPQQRNNAYNRGEDRGARGPQHGGNRGGNVRRGGGGGGEYQDNGGDGGQRDRGYGRQPERAGDEMDDDIPFIKGLVQ